MSTALRLQDAKRSPIGGGAAVNAAGTEAPR
jgi:hypothetical protein